jgi:hypothetical protein
VLPDGVQHWQWLGLTPDDCAQNGVLIDMYARSDITQLARGNAYNRLQWEEVTVGQALALAQIASPPNAQHGPVAPVGTAAPAHEPRLCACLRDAVTAWEACAPDKKMHACAQGQGMDANHSAASKPQRVYVCTAHDTFRCGALLLRNGQAGDEQDPCGLV